MSDCANLDKTNPTYEQYKNATIKELKKLGLKLMTTDDFNGWQYNWQSTNGFKESEILEAITDK